MLGPVVICICRTWSAKCCHCDQCRSGTYERFASLNNVVPEKGEIIDALGTEGMVVLNADDLNCQRWVSCAGRVNTCYSASMKMVMRISMRETAVANADSAYRFEGVSELILLRKRWRFISS